MKKSLFFALTVVSTLTCISPACAKVSTNQNYFSCRNTSLIENTGDVSNTQCSNRAVQPGKFDGMLSLNPTNQSTISNNKQVSEANPADRGKPSEPIPAGRRYWQV